MMDILKDDISAACMEFGQLTSEQLSELCHSNSDQRYEDLVNKSQMIKTLEAKRDLLVASAISLAESNLNKQVESESNRAALLRLVTEANQLKDRVQGQAALLMSQTDRLARLLSLILDATSKSEEKSELLVETFLTQKMDYDTFLSEFLEERKLAHLRRIKADKLSQLKASNNKPSSSSSLVLCN